ncbi:MAG: Ku protein [Acetobacteraceae bacterium]|nr:Ku protein [Acetobacteraceae bacterium]
MADRPIWRGHLRLALVSCPVALYTARRERGDLRFHLINPKTGHRIRMVTQDAETDEELSRRDLVKGYEFKKDHYLILTDEDFESAKVESSTIMTVEKFVEAQSLDPIYYDSSYYLVPDGEAGQDVYIVLRDAIASTRRVALSRVVIARRERTIALMPMQNGMVVHTLYEERDIADPKPLFDAIPNAKPDPELVKLAVQLVDRQTGRYEPADMEDHYETKLRAVIEAKLTGQGIEPDGGEAPDRDNVIDLMAALKRSLGETAAAEQSRGEAAPPARGAAKRAAAKSPPRANARKPARKRA